MGKDGNAKNSELSWYERSELSQRIAKEEKELYQREFVHSRKKINQQEKSRLDSRIIRVQSVTNPKIRGTAVWARFNLYRDGMTVRIFLKKGGKRADLKYDEHRRYIRLENPDG